MPHEYHILLDVDESRQWYTSFNTRCTLRNRAKRRAEALGQSVWLISSCGTMRIAEVRADGVWRTSQTGQWKQESDTGWE